MGTNFIWKIDPETGKAVKAYDLTFMQGAAKASYPQLDVLNGIAYDSKNDKLYVTGKYWPLLYEIQLN